MEEISGYDITSPGSITNPLLFEIPGYVEHSIQLLTHYPKFDDLPLRYRGIR